MDLRIASRAIPESDKVNLEPNVVEAFRGNDGATFKTDHPLSKAAFLHLLEIQPKSIPFPTLASEAGKVIGNIDSAEIKREHMTLAASILQAYSYSDSLVELHSIDLPFTIAISNQPRVSSVARWAASKGIQVTNFRHERVELDLMMELILPKLDGEHSQEDIVEWLIANYREGALVLESGGERLGEGEDVRQYFEENLKKILSFCSRAALLEA